jgi:hypothetical protein
LAVQVALSPPQVPQQEAFLADLAVQVALSPPQEAFFAGLAVQVPVLPVTGQVRVESFLSEQVPQHVPVGLGFWGDWVTLLHEPLEQSFLAGD